MSDYSHPPTLDQGGQLLFVAKNKKASASCERGGTKHLEERWWFSTGDMASALLPLLESQFPTPWRRKTIKQGQLASGSLSPPQ